MSSWALPSWLLKVANDSLFAVLFSLGQVDHMINREKISSEGIIILALIELELPEPLSIFELDSKVFVGVLEEWWL